MVRQFAVNEITTFRWSFEEDVRRYRDMGVTTIGVWRRKLAEFGEDAGLDLLRECRLRVSSLMWAGGFTGIDGRTHAESIDDGLDAVRLAAAMGAGCLVIYTGGRGGHTHKHARKLATDALRELAGLADDLDVVLAIEPFHPRCCRDWTFLRNLTETLAFLDELNAAKTRVKMVFDTYHLSGCDPEEVDWSAIAPRIGLVQLADARQPPVAEQDRCPLGEGRLPLCQIVQALKAAGYQGDFELELIGEEIEDRDANRLLEESRRAYALWQPSGNIDSCL